MRHYLDTSAVAKLVLDEPESAALAAFLDGLDEADELVAGALLETELRRVAVRVELDQADVTDVLDRVDLVDLPRSLFREAGILPGAGLRSLDALHLALAMRLDVDAVLVYDQRMIDAARAVGLSVLSPPSPEADAADERQRAEDGEDR